MSVEYLLVQDREMQVFVKDLLNDGRTQTTILLETIRKRFGHTPSTFSEELAHKWRERTEKGTLYQIHEGYIDVKRTL